MALSLGGMGDGGGHCLEVRYEIRAIIACCGYQAVPWLEGDAVDGEGPSAGGGVDKSELSGRAVEQLCGGIVECIHLGEAFFGRLVAALEFLLVDNVSADRRHGARHQCCPCIVQMDPQRRRRATSRVCPNLCDVYSSSGRHPRGECEEARRWREENDQ